MKQHRHAGSPRPSAATLGRSIRLAVIVLATGLAGVAAVAGAISLRMARRVVTPAAREQDTRIVDLDTAAQTITLTRTPDTRLPGRYGLATDGTLSYVKLGTVLAETDTTVTRKLLTEIDASDRLARRTRSCSTPSRRTTCARPSPPRGGRSSAGPATSNPTR